MFAGFPGRPAGGFGVWGRGNSLQGPPGPANKLGAWCRSSPTGGTNFQNPNFEIPSFVALWSEPAALRNPQKKAIPDFTSILAFSSEPAALRNPQKKGDPQKTLHVSSFFEHVFPTFAVHYFFPADPFERGSKIASQCHLIHDFYNMTFLAELDYRELNPSTQ